MDRRLNGLYPLAYAGVNPVTPAPFLVQQRDPTTTDSQNVVLGTFWLNNKVSDPHYKYVWVLVALVNNVATWVLFATGAGSLISLTASDGTIATPIVGNITFPDLAFGNNVDSNLQSTATAGIFDLNVKPIISLPTTGVVGGIFIGGAIKIGGTANTDVFMHSLGSFNTFLGNRAGSPNLNLVSATLNTGIGSTSLGSLSTGFANTAVGANALNLLTSGSGNNAFGDGSLSALTTGFNNVAVGEVTLQGLLTGDHNVALGNAAGQNYAGAERDNILILHLGVLGENNTIRIGTQGTGVAQQNRFFAAGIYNTAIGGVNSPVFIDSNGQLGTGVGGSTWIDQTTTPAAMVVNGSYIADTAGLLTFTLPAVAPQGTYVRVAGNGAGGWRIAQNAGQVINFIGMSTTVGVAGSLSSTVRYDCVDLLCTVANTTWVVRTVVGNLTVV